MNRKMRLLKGLMAFIVGVSIIATPIITVYAASNKVAISMNRRAVNGATNGKYHSLNKGTVKLKVSAKGFGNSNPNSWVTLHKEKFGIDDYFGRVSISSGKNYFYKNKTKEIPTKANTKSSKYYLKAEKAMDWYTVKIEGTISN
ncbi:Lmo1656 family SNX6-recruiting virulence factor [Listeria monocytogenes]|nr:Lmo1656 family SNX6-recruiting virulence factor [Listeria monocytogenes]